MTTVNGVDTREVLTGWSLIDQTDGFGVDNDMHDDPILVGPDGQPVTTWMEGYPYRERMTRREYEVTKRAVQIELLKLQSWVKESGQKVVIIFEGRDAAGKGGNIRRVTECLDPRGYGVIPIAAPKGDDATHHYLWRFWRQLPKAGHLAIFDRTWYGRVLVERVEGFCSEAEWRRAYQEIKEFELSLTNYGTILVKFWLHISKEEQLRRFEERKEIDYKQYKITEEDWRNREKWDQYRQAVVDMLTNTSTTYAPWTIVEANDKLWARIRSLQAIVDAIELGLGQAKKRRKGYEGEREKDEKGKDGKKDKDGKKAKKDKEGKKNRK